MFNQRLGEICPTDWIFVYAEKNYHCEHEFRISVANLQSTIAIHAYVASHNAFVKSNQMPHEPPVEPTPKLEITSPTPEAYLPDDEIVKMLLGPATTEAEVARWSPNVLHHWKSRFAIATERAWAAAHGFAAIDDGDWVTLEDLAGGV